MQPAPVPTSMEDAARWQEQGRRYRLLHGDWAQDAQDMQRRMMGLIRADAHGVPDLSSNVFLQGCRELGIHYNDGGVVLHPDAAAAASMQAVLDAAGWSPIMQALVVNLIGIREMLVRVTDIGGALQLRPVYPHNVCAWGHPDSPDVPTRVEELRHRIVDGAPMWCWDVLDVTDPESPIYRVESDTGSHRTDITEAVLGQRYDGAAYPYRLDGVPILPYAMYHARVWPCMWGYRDGVEVVDGTLRSAVHWTYFGHVLRNAAWRQRYVIDGEVAGDEVELLGGGRRREAVADPAVLLEIITRNDGGTAAPQGARVGSFELPVSPVEMFEGVARYDRRVSAGFGVSAADFERQEGDPRSAYALLLSADGKVRAARAYTEGIRRGDRQLLRIVAAILGMPADGWDVAYPAVPDALRAGEPTAVQSDGSTDPAADASVDAGGAAPGAPTEDVAKTALNGAQAAFLLDALARVQAGEIPKSGAVAAVQLALPFVSPAEIETMFADAEAKPADDSEDPNYVEPPAAEDPAEDAEEGSA